MHTPQKAAPRRQPSPRPEALSVERDETALSSFRRRSKATLRTEIEFIDEPYQGEGLKPGTIVELTGASGTGKTEVLLNVAVQCVLGTEFGGNGGCAFFFDSEGRLSIHRLNQLITERIKNSAVYGAGLLSAVPGISPMRRSEQESEQQESEQEGGEGQTDGGPDGVNNYDLQTHILAALQRLKVVKCLSSFEAVAALEILSYELDSVPAVILVDGITSFWWRDRQALRYTNSPGNMQPMMLAALVRLAKTKNVVIFATLKELYPGRRDVEPSRYQQGTPQRLPGGGGEGSSGSRGRGGSDSRHRRSSGAASSTASPSSSGAAGKLWGLPDVWTKAVHHRIRLQRYSYHQQHNSHHQLRQQQQPYQEEQQQQQELLYRFEATVQMGQEMAQQSSFSSDNTSSYAFVVHDSGIKNIPRPALSAARGFPTPMVPAFES